MFYTQDTIAPICKRLHETGKKVVLATGFFDLLHREHINFLKKARVIGDVLIVAVESDQRAKQLKGEGRPIESQPIRCKKISELCDYVLVLSDDFNNLAAYDSLMQTIRPDIYAVSKHTDYLDNKTKLTTKYGGKLVIVHDFNPDVSTTKIIQSTTKQL